MTSPILFTKKLCNLIELVLVWSYFPFFNLKIRETPPTFLLRRSILLGKSSVVGSFFNYYF